MSDGEVDYLKTKFDYVKDYMPVRRLSAGLADKNFAQHFLSAPAYVFQDPTAPMSDSTTEAESKLHTENIIEQWTLGKIKLPHDPMLICFPLRYEDHRASLVAVYAIIDEKYTQKPKFHPGTLVLVNFFQRLLAKWKQEHQYIVLPNGRPEYIGNKPDRLNDQALTTALNCLWNLNNKKTMIDTCTAPRKKAQKFMIGKYAKIGLTYHVLNLKNDIKTPNILLNTGTHAPPRWHQRRGHWRRVKDRRVWVKPCEVGDRERGAVVKDYAVTAQQEQV